MIRFKKTHFSNIFLLTLLFSSTMSGEVLCKETPGTSGEQLIVFLQSGNTAVEKAFREEQLPKIKAICEEMGVSFHVADVMKGAPEEITIHRRWCFKTQGDGQFIRAGRIRLIAYGILSVLLDLFLKKISSISVRR